MWGYTYLLWIKAEEQHNKECGSLFPVVFPNLTLWHWLWEAWTTVTVPPSRNVRFGLTSFIESVMLISVATTQTKLIETISSAVLGLTADLCRTKCCSWSRFPTQHQRLCTRLWWFPRSVKSSLCVMHQITHVSCGRCRHRHWCGTRRRFQGLGLRGLLSPGQQCLPHWGMLGLCCKNKEISLNHVLILWNAFPVAFWSWSYCF